MIIKELIETLSTLDPNLRVVTRGYEGGYDDIEWPVGKDSPNIINLALHVNPAWYYGNHEMVGPNYTYKDKQIVKAIVL
jgi:hypothetical protein